MSLCSIYWLPLLEPGGSKTVVIYILERLICGHFWLELPSNLAYHTALSLRLAECNIALIRYHGYRHLALMITRADIDYHNIAPLEQ